MAKADTSVKYFHSAMQGAPVLSGTAGTLIAVLDACLVNGFGLKTVDTLVVAGGVATASISTGHSADKDSVVLIAGATPAELNGEWKVEGTTTNTITFATPGILDQTASGTITVKLSPAGWLKPFSGTNLAAYKSSLPESTGMYLRVDDTSAKAARVVGYESMTDVNSGLGQFPTTTQRSGGLWWSKSGTADTAARSWMVATDGRMLYVSKSNYPSGGSKGNEITAFGDFIPTKSGDPFACILTGMATDVSSSDQVIANQYWYSDSSSAEWYCPRSYTGLGGSIAMGRTMPSVAYASSWTSGQVGSGSSGLRYPNPTDGGLYVVPHYLNEYVALALRGISPGFYGVPQFVPVDTFVSRDIVTGVVGLPGKTLRAAPCSNSFGVCFLETTGPWR